MRPFDSGRRPSLRTSPVGLAALLALSLAGPASAFWPFGEAILRPDPLKGPEAAAEQGRWSDAAALAKSAIDSQSLRAGERERAFELLGRGLSEQGRYDEALGSYQLAVGLYPNSWPLILAQARLLQKVGLDKEARPLYEKVLRLHKGDAEAHLGLAESYGRLGLLEGAAKHYRLALAGESAADPSAWSRYASILGLQRDFFNAEQAAQRSLSLAPVAAVWEAKAVYQFRQGKADQALESLAEAEKLAPADADLALRRCLWLIKLGRLDEARARVDAVLKADPQHGLGLWTRGLLKLRSGRKDEAQRDFFLAQAHGKGFVSDSAAAMAKALKENKP